MCAGLIVDAMKAKPRKIQLWKPNGKRWKFNYAIPIYDPTVDSDAFDLILDDVEGIRIFPQHKDWFDFQEIRMRMHFKPKKSYDDDDDDDDDEYNDDDEEEEEEEEDDDDEYNDDDEEEEEEEDDDDDEYNDPYH